MNISTTLDNVIQNFFRSLEVVGFKTVEAFVIIGEHGATVVNGVSHNLFLS
jgi:hypothetical protein